MIPTPGRIVLYTLCADDAFAITQRRDDVRTGAQARGGNPVKAGDEFPLVITRVWATPETVTEATACNGQVLLDGNDTLWVTSVHQGDGERHWRDPRETASA